jgi:hypothetical protein
MNEKSRRGEKWHSHLVPNRARGWQWYTTFCHLFLKKKEKETGLLPANATVVDDWKVGHSCLEGGQSYHQQSKALNEIFSSHSQEYTPVALHNLCT